MYHIEDNLRSDVQVSKKLGIPYEVFTQTHLNRYEEKISEENHLPLKFRSLLAGASKLTRLQSQETNSNKQVIWETAASAIAPILFGFVYWCLVEAQKRGIQRLYFVARDGQILHKIALIICKNWGFTIECRYLYGSRQAWNMPAIQEIGEDELFWILFWSEDSTQFVSIRSMCDRVNISPEQIQDVLSRYGFPAAKWDLNLQKHERALLKQIVTEKEVAELIISTAAIYREKVSGYFRQESLGDGVPFGFVDVGWSGRTQRSFSKLLKIAGLYPESGIHGFYFALQSRVKPFQRDRLLAYFFDVDTPAHRKMICEYRGLYELFMSADHGSTVRYEQQGEQYIPILRSDKNQEAISWGLYAMQGAIVEFTEQLTANLSKGECTTQLFLEVSENLAKELVLNPSRQEAKVFGSFLFSGDITEKAFYELAPLYNLTDWFRFMVLDEYAHTDVWFPASVARSNPIVQKLYNLRTNSKNKMILSIRKILGGLKRDLILRTIKTN